MAHTDVRWPWAPVIIGSTLVLLSIIMRLYGFNTAFINVVASIGDVIVIFSLLYIIKIFLIDETPLPAGALGHMDMMSTYQTGKGRVREENAAIAHAEERQAESSALALLHDIVFTIVDVDDAKAQVHIRGLIQPQHLRGMSPSQAMMALLVSENRIKDRISSWAGQQHGQGFIVSAVMDVNVTETSDGGVALSAIYALSIRT